MLFLDSGDFEAAFALLEGERCLEYTLANDTGCSIMSARKQFAELEYESESGLTHIVVYGSGGGHRFYVRSNGEVKFSNGHIGMTRVQDVLDLGFTII